MSDDLERLIEQGENHLQHYGVKGMKWGVRKNESSSSSKRPAVKKLAVKSVKAAGKASALSTLGLAGALSINALLAEVVGNTSYTLYSEEANKALDKVRG